MKANAVALTRILLELSENPAEHNTSSMHAYGCEILRFETVIRLQRPRFLSGSTLVRGYQFRLCAGHGCGTRLLPGSVARFQPLCPQRRHNPANPARRPHSWSDPFR